MINMRDDILLALEQNENLAAQLDEYRGYAAIFGVKAPANQDFDTYLIYSILNQTDTHYGDNNPLAENIQVHISIFTKTGSTSSLSEQTIQTMKGLGFSCTYNSEMADEGQVYIHIPMRFQTKKTKPKGVN
ncbi:hypothetical protein [Halobacillus ihumii]|uniref:hypothetical protein n=1 Tax=Halobacillus ihumii TaxID=2686092 RepID=UPI0013D1B76D|nr:hypothetical protein [Halobacillus ihumii]